MNIKFQISNFKYQMFILLFVIGSYLILVIPANAQGTSLAVYPPIFQIDATPPANVQAPLSIENQGNETINLKIELRPFSASDREDGQINYISQKEANFEDPLIFQRVKIFDPSTGSAGSLQASSGQEITTLSLSPKQKKDLILKIDLPKDESATDYYFSVIFLTANNPSLETNSSQSVSGIATNVLLSIGPKGKPEGNIQEFTSPIFVEKGPVPFTIRVKNTTNHFITPKGNLLIQNLFGQTIGKVDLAQTNILANTVRNIPASPAGGPSVDGNQMAAYWPEKFILGIYKATLTVALSDSGPLYKRDILFFAFPFKTTALIVIGFGVLIYFITKVKRKI